MIVTCEACSTRFNLNDELVKPSGSRVRCSKCQKVFRAYLPITEEPSLALTAETSDTNLELSSIPPVFDFSQLNELEAQKIELSDHSSETPSFPTEYLDMTEFDFTEIDKLIQSDQPDKSELDIPEPDKSESDLLILPGDLVPEPSLSDIESPEAPATSDELDKLLEIDLSNLSLDQPEFTDRLDDLSSDFKALPSDQTDQNFEKEIADMNLALDSKTELSESKPSMEVSLDEFEKSLEMNFADISLLSPGDDETASYLAEKDIDETVIEKSKKATDDLISEDDLGGLDDIEDLDLTDIETLLEEQDAGRFTTSVTDGTESFKRSDSVIDPASLNLESDEPLDMEDDQYLTFDELQLDKDESDSGTLLEVKESFSPDIEILEPPSEPPLQKESEIKKTESDDEEKPPLTDAVVEEEPEEAQPEPKKGISPLMIVLLILAVIAGLVYGGYTLLNSMGVSIPFISQPAPSKVQDPGNFKIKPFDISSKFVDNTKSGKFFIIVGKVKNEYPAARGSIQVIGKLYTKDKAMAKAETVFCGNVISDMDLANTELATIQERLQNRSGDNGTNLKVAPGDAIPFMIVFSNLPDNLEEFTLEVKASAAV
jgi:pilus assembly protein FimV